MLLNLLYHCKREKREEREREITYEIDSIHDILKIASTSIKFFRSRFTSGFQFGSFHLCFSRFLIFLHSFFIKKSNKHERGALMSKKKRLTKVQNKGETTSASWVNDNAFDTSNGEIGFSHR